MLKTFYIYFLFYISVFAAVNSSGQNYRLIAPEYIPINSSFDVSLITSNPYPTADQLLLYIIPSGSLSLNKVELNSLNEKLNLDFSSATLDGFIDPVYKTYIDLTDTSISQGTYFQILMNLNSDNEFESSLKVLGVFMQADSVLGYLNSGSDFTNDIQENVAEIPLKFYKPEKSAGKSLLLGENSTFQVPLKNFKSNNLLMDFWIKLNDPGTEILQIKNNLNSQPLFDLSTNSFQTLTVNSDEYEQQFISPYFMGKKSWYHISILFSYNNNEAYFYCNGTLISKNYITNLPPPENLESDFGIKDQKKSFQIDLLRFVDLHNSIDASFRNKNYLSFLSDSSRVLAQFQFNNIDDFNSLKSNLNIISSGTQLVKSDAPIFARAPELNINPLNDTYELDWSGGDYKQAEKYILQKSTNNSQYVDIFTIQADNSEAKNYTFIDVHDENSDIVYYRVEQVNLDGTTVYSSAVKVGQGKTQPFVVEPNYPNPFNPKTSITVDLLQDSELQIIIYNMEGKEIIQLFKGSLSKGTHVFSFNATDLPSGVYLYKVATPDYTETKKMILTK